MPNHCTNYLTIKGDAVSIKRFHTSITTGVGEIQEHEDFRILDNLLPTPNELHQVVKNGEYSPKKDANIAKYGHADWYEWNCENYGSKWSDFDGQFNSVQSDEIRLVFISAWSPVCEGIRQVSLQFPTLDFILTYEEGGMGFCGGVAIHNGNTLTEIEGQYPSFPEGDPDDYEGFYELVSDETNRIHQLLLGSVSEAKVS